VHRHCRRVTRYELSAWSVSRTVYHVRNDK
jgi:hypothetical protein